MNIIQKKAREAIKQYGGLLKAAAALQIDQSTMSRVASGKKRSVSPKTLRRLGLKRAIIPDNS
jgi:hypothetical protein